MSHLKLLTLIIFIGTRKDTKRYMKEITAKLLFYDFVSSMKSSLDLVDLYFNLLSSGEFIPPEDIRIIIDGVGKEKVMTWILEGMSLPDVESLIKKETQGIVEIINTISCYKRLQAEGRFIPEQYDTFAKELSEHLPTKSAVKKHYEIYRSFVESLINSFRANKLYLEMMDKSEKTSRYVAMYHRILVSLTNDTKKTRLKQTA